MKKAFFGFVCMLMLSAAFMLTASAETAEYCPARGDVDFDGEVAAADARLILRASVGLERYEKGTVEYIAADVDSDGSLSAADARLVLRRSVGLEKGFAHIPVKVSGREATCTQTGLTGGKVCTVCKKTLVKQESISALGHTKKTVPGKAATCTEAGLTDGKVCTVCKKTLVKQESISALGHTEKTVPGKAATCTETGLTDGTVCEVCKAVLVEQDVIPAMGHTPAESGAVAPAFENDGLTALVTCSVCKTVLSEQKVIPAVKNLIKESSSPVEINVAVTENYPWIYSEAMSADGAVVYVSSNRGRDNSASDIALTVRGGGILSFDLYVSSEEDYDGVSRSNDAPITLKDDASFISGEKGWLHEEILITGKAETDATVLYLAYTKDKSRAAGDDTAAIKNIEWLSGEKTLAVSAAEASTGSVSAKTSGGQTPASGGKVNVGETVTLKAVPASGYDFLCIKDASGKTVSLVPEYSFVMRKDSSFTAEFYKKGDYEAKIGDKLFTDIDEAIGEAESGDTVTVLRDCALSENAVIKKGVTLLVPCKDNDVGYCENGYNPDSSFGSGYTEGRLYRTLTVPEDVSLDVYGTLLINAETSRAINGDPNGYGITGGYGKTQLAGKITVFPGGVLDCSGITDGTGTVLVKNGAAMYETYSIELWRGGTVSLLYEYLVNRNYPVFANSMNACRTELIIESGARYCGTVKLHHDEKNEYCRFPVIDNSVGLFRLRENAYIRRSVVWDDALPVKKAGAVVKGGYRDEYEFFGGADIVSCVMNLNGVELGTDACSYFSFDGDASFTVKDGVYNVEKCFRFQPGFRFTVDSGAEVNVKNGGGLMFVDSAYTELDSLFWGSHSYPAGRKDSVMYIKDGGKLNVASGGELTGKVECDDISDAVIADGAVTVQSFKVTAAPGGTTDINKYVSNVYSVSLHLSETVK